MYSRLGSNRHTIARQGRLSMPGGNAAAPGAHVPQSHLAYTERGLEASARQSTPDQHLPSRWRSMQL